MKRESVALLAIAVAQAFAASIFITALTSSERVSVTSADTSNGQAQTSLVAEVKSKTNSVISIHNWMEVQAVQPVNTSGEPIVPNAGSHDPVTGDPVMYMDIWIVNVYDFNYP